MRLALRIFALTVLLLTIGGHFSELFDTWDHTFQTGREADYAVVLIAAVTGSVFLAVSSVRKLRRPTRILRRVAAVRPLMLCGFPEPLDLHSTSPPVSPLSLRI
jgi:hypothetical protein